MRQPPSSLQRRVAEALDCWGEIENLPFHRQVAEIRSRFARDFEAQALLLSLINGGAHPQSELAEQFLHQFDSRPSSQPAHSPTALLATTELRSPSDPTAQADDQPRQREEPQQQPLGDDRPSLHSVPASGDRRHLRTAMTLGACVALLSAAFALGRWSVLPPDSVASSANRPTSAARADRDTASEKRAVHNEPPPSPEKLTMRGEPSDSGGSAVARGAGVVSRGSTERSAALASPSESDGPENVSAPGSSPVRDLGAQLYAARFRLAVTHWQNHQPLECLALLCESLPDPQSVDSRGTEWWWLWEQAYRDFLEDPEVAAKTTGQVAGQTTGQVAGQTTGQVAGQAIESTASEQTLRNSAGTEGSAEADGQSMVVSEAARGAAAPASPEAIDDQAVVAQASKSSPLPWGTPVFTESGQIIEHCAFSPTAGRYAYVTGEEKLVLRVVGEAGQRVVPLSNFATVALQFSLDGSLIGLRDAGKKVRLVHFDRGRPIDVPAATASHQFLAWDRHPDSIGCLSGDRVTFYNSEAAPTQSIHLPFAPQVMAAAGDHMWLVGNENVVCLDSEGKPLWRRELGVPLQRVVQPAFATDCLVVATESRIIWQVGGKGIQSRGEANGDVQQLWLSPRRERLIAHVDRGLQWLDPVSRQSLLQIAVPHDAGLFFDSHASTITWCGSQRGPAADTIARWRGMDDGQLLRQLSHVVAVEPQRQSFSEGLRRQLARSGADAALITEVQQRIGAAAARRLQTLDLAAQMPLAWTELRLDEPSAAPNARTVGEAADSSNTKAPHDLRTAVAVLPPVDPAAEEPTTFRLLQRAFAAAPPTTAESESERSDLERLHRMMESMPRGKVEPIATLEGSAMVKLDDRYLLLLRPRHLDRYDLLTGRVQQVATLPNRPFLGLSDPATGSVYIATGGDFDAQMQRHVSQVPMAILRYDTTSWLAETLFSCCEGRPHQLLLTTDRRYLMVASAHNGIIRCDLETGEGVLDDQIPLAYCLQRLPGRSEILVSDESTLHTLDPETMQITRQIEAPLNVRRHVAAFPNHPDLALCLRPPLGSGWIDLSDGRLIVDYATPIPYAAPVVETENYLLTALPEGNFGQFFADPSRSPRIFRHGGTAILGMAVFEQYDLVLFAESGGISAVRLPPADTTVEQRESAAFALLEQLEAEAAEIQAMPRTTLTELQLSLDRSKQLKTQLDGASSELLEADRARFPALINLLDQPDLSYLDIASRLAEGQIYEVAKVNCRFLALLSENEVAFGEDLRVAIVRIGDEIETVYQTRNPIMGLDFDIPGRRVLIGETNKSTDPALRAADRRSTVSELNLDTRETRVLSSKVPGVVRSLIPINRGSEILLASEGTPGLRYDGMELHTMDQQLPNLRRVHVDDTHPQFLFAATAIGGTTRVHRLDRESLKETQRWDLGRAADFRRHYVSPDGTKSMTICWPKDIHRAETTGGRERVEDASEFDFYSLPTRSRDGRSVWMPSRENGLLKYSLDSIDAPPESFLPTERVRLIAVLPTGQNASDDPTAAEVLVVALENRIVLFRP
jgi:hypothetical protein